MAPAAAPRPAGAALGLYIHVPFCVRKCRYCDFYSAPYDVRAGGRFMEALAGESAQARHALGQPSPVVSTVYIGGGTPTVLSRAQWKRLLALVRGDFSIDPSCEWTVECNPESFDEQTVALWAAAGVSRVSFGVQTLDDRLLRLLGRPHTAAQALGVLASDALSEFQSVSADIMYGLPGQELPALERTLHEVLATGRVNHVSAYQLTIAPRTPFGRHRRLLPLPAEGTVVEHYRLVERLLTAAGFEHYEVSNYARPGHRCRHNCACWRHEPYLGLGPAAHSFVPPRRWGNVTDTEQYAALVREGRPASAFTETLGAAEYGREVVMLGLRTSDGISGARYHERTGEPLDAAGRGETLCEFVGQGLLVRQGDNYVPTARGMLLADAMARRICRDM